MSSPELSMWSVNEQPPTFALSEIHRFIKECMLAVEAPPDHAQALADCLTQADYRGHSAHGLNQLETHIDEILHGGCNKNAKPEIIRDTPVTAWVNGNNGLGVIVGNFCMDIAIQKAKDIGIGFVVAKGSNSYGASSIYSLRALDEGFIGVSFTNSSPLVAPSRALESALGTNPLSLAAPALDGDSFVLDMDTAAVPVGMIEMLSRKGLPVPSEWTHPETGALKPLGINEDNSNYKGFGLALFVEIFCGILADSAYGPNVRKYGRHHEKANLAHCFIVINPSYFAPGFENRLSDLMNFIRNMQPADPTKPVLVPGDFERDHMAAVDQQGGVTYVWHLVKSLSKLARKLNVEILNPLE